jgi:hypothetical protein
MTILPMPRHEYALLKASVGTVGTVWQCSGSILCGMSGATADNGGLQHWRPKEKMPLSFR